MSPHRRALVWLTAFSAAASLAVVGSSVTTQQTGTAATVAASADANSAANVENEPLKGTRLVGNAVAGAAMLGCIDLDNVDDCLQSRVRSGIENNGVAATLGSIYEASLVALPDPFPCHLMHHETGWIAMELGVSSSVSEMVSFEQGNCGFGYIHGVIVWAAQHEGFTPDTVAKTCKNLQAELFAQCAHALGHATAFEQPNNILEALKLCDSAIGDVGRNQCANGVFMAFGVGRAGFTGLDSELLITAAPQDVEGLCLKVGSAYERECWLGLWMLYVQDRTLADVDALTPACSEATGEALNHCFQGVGHLLRVVTGNEVEAVANCPYRPLNLEVDAPDYIVGDARHYHDCVFGVAWAKANDALLTGVAWDDFDSLCADLAPGSNRRCEAAEFLAFHPGTPEQDLPAHIRW